MIHYDILLLGVVSHVLAAPANINIQDIIDPHAEGGSAGMGDNEDFDAVAFLESAHYLDKVDHSKGQHYAPDSVKQGIREFQAFTGLNVTGRLDKATVTMIRKPRCGVPDVIRPSERTNKDPNAPLAYKAFTGWDWTDLTYSFGSFTRDLPVGDQRRTIADALSRWAAVTPLNFFRTHDNTADADLILKFVTGDHGDDSPFDGKGGTLAHAFQPGDQALSGDLHFDDGEDYTINSPDGTNLLHTAIHELGHSMGLGHSSDQNAIMFPYYMGFNSNPQLGQDDIRGVQSLYGPRPPGPKPTGTPRPRPTTTTPAPELCGIIILGVAQVHDGKTYIFGNNRFIHEYTTSGPLLRQTVGDVFRGGPPDFQAIVYDRVHRHTFMFKGSQYWRFTGYNLDRGYPKPLARAFQGTAGAIFGPDNKIYLFQSDRYSPWDEEKTSYEKRPARITRVFRGAPSNVDAAFRDRDGYTYLFRDHQYWRYEGGPGRYTLSAGYPKDIKPDWLHCNN